MDTIKPTQRNTILGFLADIAKDTYSPQRTQQMQGISKFLGAPDIASTLDRLSYGESLTSGKGMTTRMKPETKGVLTSLLDYIPTSKPALAGAGLAGMFIGKGAKTWDAIAASRAQELARKGADARQIWKETGTFKGPDGVWRQEIDDSAATVFTPKGAALEYMQDMGPSEYPVKLKEHLNHSNAFSAYPNLSELNTRLKNSMSGGAYEFDSFGGSMTVPARVKAGSLINPDQSKSTTLHEIQHDIQQREGWAKGGSPDDAELMPYVRKFYADNIDKFDGESHQLVSMAKQRAYNNLAGEAEARATQARMNMNMQQRRELFPLDSYDVPADNLIIRGLLE